MQIQVCDICAATNQNATGVDPQIEKISVRARQNGSDESVFDGNLEACQPCRTKILEDIRLMFNPGGTLSVTMTFPNQKGS